MARPAPSRLFPWRPLGKKRKGKGRVKKRREIVFLPPPTVPEREPEALFGPSRWSRHLARSSASNRRVASATDNPVARHDGRARVRNFSTGVVVRREEVHA